jgi:hypothetical protein
VIRSSSKDNSTEPPKRGGSESSGDQLKKGPWAALAAWVPGPLIALINQWLGIFQHLTIFSNPDWQKQADATSLAVSVVVAAVVCAIWADKKKETKERFAKLYLYGFLWLGVFCGLCHFGFLNFPIEPPLYGIVQAAWEVAYVFMIAAMVVAVTFAALYKLPTSTS